MPPAIPPEYGSVTPYLIVPDGDEALAFYARAFGAVEHLKLNTPDGRRVVHAEMKIGDSIVMLSAATPEMEVARVEDGQWPPISLLLYVEDVDAVYHQAVAAGCISETEPTDMFYGDRAAKLRDPFGHRWAIATHKEDVPPDEIERRFAKMMGS